jgi:hypothetical protein
MPEFFFRNHGRSALLLKDINGIFPEEEMARAQK